VLVQTPFSHSGALEPCTGRDYSGPANRPKYRPTQAQRCAADRYRKMIKTFSFSALFFMTIGVLLATHLSLPF
jgi:hypothetical protein